LSRVYVGMKPNVTAIERAFELARTGRYVRLAQLRADLRNEGYSQELIVGRYLSAQLRQLMREANPQSYDVGKPIRQYGGTHPLLTRT